MKSSLIGRLLERGETVVVRTPEFATPHRHLNPRTLCRLAGVLSVQLAAVAVESVGSEHILVNRIGPVGSTLWIANADGSAERPLLGESPETLDYNPSFGGGDEWIVFTSERSGSADIYRVRADGSQLERLTDHAAFDDQAALSPDGSRLAFVSTRTNGFANLHILDLATRAIHCVEEVAAGCFRPSWSPDGRWLAFSSDRDTPLRRAVPRWEQLQETNIFLIRPDGSGLRRLTTPGKLAGSPKWSADGRRIVFFEMEVEDTYDVRRWGEAARGDSQIVSLAVDDGSRQVLSAGLGLKLSPQFLTASDESVGYLLKLGVATAFAFSAHQQRGEGGQRSPAWSTDGRKVVYHRYSDAVFQQNQPLYSMHSELALTYSDPFPAFSTDGARLVYCDKLGSGHPGALAALAVVDLSGHAVRRIFQEDGALIVTPSWSPDGEYLIFGLGHFFAQRPRGARLMMIRGDGAELKELSSGPGNQGFPSWSPDGQQVVYRVWSESEQGLRLLNLHDGSSTALTHDYDNFPVWSPCGSWIAFTRLVDENFDVFVIRPDGSDLRQLTTAPGNDGHCAWSPDGTQILFSSSRFGFKDEAALASGIPQPYAELFVMNVDGSDQRALTDNQWEEGTPAWRPQFNTRR